MNISRGQVIAIICLLVAIILFLASKMLVWQPSTTLTDWKGTFKKSVFESNKFSIYKIGDGNTCLAFGETGQLKEFFNAITIDESIVETVMMPGSFKITFESGDTIISSLEIVGRNHLRWRNGEWPSDAKLTQSSSVALHKWLANVVENTTTHSAQRGAEGGGGSEGGNP